MPIGAMGHVRAPDKDLLIAESQARHGARLKMLNAAVADQAPASYDVRTLVPAILPPWDKSADNQASCGSCWLFSGVGVAEAALVKAGVLTVSQRLSRQYGLDCQRNGGCNGDDNVTALAWSKKDGNPLTSDYGPYQGSAGRCRSQAGQVTYKIDDWGFADNSGGNGVTPTDQIKTAIMAYGLVGCAVAAGNDSFWDSGTSIGSGRDHSIDHDVALGGWQDTGTVVMAAVGPAGNHLPSTTTATGWWWMKNNWYPWGLDGWAKIAYGAYDIGTETVWAKVASVLPPPPVIPPWLI